LDTVNESTFTALAEPALGAVVAATSLEKPKPSKYWSFVALLVLPL